MNNPGLIKSFTAGGVISPYRIVKLSSDTAVVQAALASDALIGVDSGLGAASGERVDIVMSGACDVEFGGSVTRGALLTSDASGKAVTASEDDRVIGVAMVSGSSGDIGSLMLGITGKVTEAQTFSALVTITTEELLALNATPKTLVAAPGSNKAVIPLDMTLMLDYNSAAYDGIAGGEDLELRHTNGAGQLFATVETTGFLSATADAVRHIFPLAAACSTPVANAALVLCLAGGEVATGNSPLKVRINYKIIDTVL